MPSLECLGNGNPLCRNTLIQKLSDLGGNLFCELQDTRVIGAQFPENDQAVFGKFKYYIGAVVQAVAAMVQLHVHLDPSAVHVEEIESPHIRRSR